MDIDLASLKERWNDVLDNLEKSNRIAWMAFFDARLASLDGSTLVLDFSDARKFAGGHEYADARASHVRALTSSIQEVTGAQLEIREQR